MSLRCLFAASEVTGFAKTGGLADVAESLPRALARRGLDVAIVAPLYHCTRIGPISVEPTEHSFSVTFGEQTLTGRLWRSSLPQSNVPVFLVEQAELFERDDAAKGRGLYQLTRADGTKADYADNSRRFAFFSRAVLEAVRLLDFWPDVLHLNDWQTGLVPVYLREQYRQTGRQEFRKRYERIRTLFTIHNLAYQGIFPGEDMPVLGLPWKLFTYELLEFYGHINFLKAGLVFADLLNTVSPMYAREIQTAYFGCGLQGVLLRRTRELCGIVNGVNYDQWDPAHDPHIAACYDSQSVVRGKTQCKAALQQSRGLNVEPGTPLLGMVSRLVDQKGLDLLREAAPALLRLGPQLVVLGEGAHVYEQMLLELQEAYPGQVSVRHNQNEPLAHQIEAGADMFLMPSQFEPCGLNQLYSLKYGTIPIVRATGGLADTVVDATAENVEQGRATGFVFVPYSTADFLEAVGRALDCYQRQPRVWQALQQTGMNQDWSWQRSAAEYEKLYEKLARMG